MARILVCGSASTDMFLGIDTDSVRTKVGKAETDLICFTCGSKIRVKDLRTTYGGGGVNVAMNLARLRNKVRFLGKVGSDGNSRELIKALRRDGVEPIYTRPSKTMGGFSLIFKSRDGDRTIITYKGANDELRWTDFDKKRLRGIDWIYLGSLLEESFQTMKKLSTWAGRNRVRTLFNPSSYVLAEGRDGIAQIAKSSEILLLNMEDSLAILGMDANAAQPTENEADTILKKLLKLGPKAVVVTNGEKRIYACDGRTKHSAMPYPVNPIDVAGAGDAFGAGFISAYSADGDIRHALRTAMACAYSAVSSPKMRISLKSMREAEDVSAEFEEGGHRIKSQPFQS